MDKNHTLVGHEELVEFGKFLNSLQQAAHGHYSFETPEASGKFTTRSLNEIIGDFQDYVDSRREVFRVRITCIDRPNGTMSCTDKEFKRISK